MVKERKEPSLRVAYVEDEKRSATWAVIFFFFLSFSLSHRGYCTARIRGQGNSKSPLLSPKGDFSLCSFWLPTMMLLLLFDYQMDCIMLMN